MLKVLIAVFLQAAIVMFVFPMIHSAFRVKGDIKSSLLVVIIFSILNVIIRWLFILSTLGLSVIVYYLTFGLIGLFINALVLVTISKVFPELIHVPTFFAAFVGGALLALVNVIFK